MKFMVTYEYGPDAFETTFKRFLETGARPPEGVKMIGRWHDAALGRGFTLCESDDAAALTAFSRTWADVIAFEVTPVIDDEEMVKVLGH